VTVRLRGNHVGDEKLAITIQLAAVHIVLWHVLARSSASHAESSRPNADIASRLWRLLTDSVGLDDTQASVQALADGLQQLLGCESVALALAHPWRRRVELVAVSHAPQLDRRTEYAAALEAALRESVLLDRDRHSVASADDPSGSPTHRRVAHLAGSEAVFSGPLRPVSGKIVGACLLTGTAELLRGAHVRETLAAASAPLASWFMLLRAARVGRLRRLWNSVRQNRRRYRVFLLFSLGLLAVIGATPVTHRLTCRCTIEPLLRRYVPAPFDGTLQETRVRPGDRVTKGQVLAVLDGRDLRFQLAGLRAKLEQAQQRADAALAKRNGGTTQLEQLAVRELELEIRTLERRCENLEVKSPLDGVVVTGDLIRMQGAPLQVGQRLFEVAPLSALLAEIAVPQEEIGYVAVGMPVELALDAVPGKYFPGTLDKVHPRAEVRDGQSVFVAEVGLQGFEERLLPGMNGHARVTAGRRSIGWILFHRPIDALRQWWGW
jgi:multidrug efflux pump subunit AcrA (membrane-fusion protein)